MYRQQDGNAMPWMKQQVPNHNLFYVVTAVKVSFANKRRLKLAQLLPGLRLALFCSRRFDCCALRLTVSSEATHS